ncbi:uncharacterized protein LOC128584266 [Nycticebus coucang]|uniref:uncharacterized protein LOC128584266 n=1 Tax=Nycticebus coucang TaxID=9470 RepID=UPI00234D1A91|nr:uncharacterized protein LOC128584266 [Nycticebus coucang]
MRAVHGQHMGLKPERGPMLFALVCSSLLAGGPATPTTGAETRELQDPLSRLLSADSLSENSGSLPVLIQLSNGQWHKECRRWVFGRKWGMKPTKCGFRPRCSRAHGATSKRDFGVTAALVTAIATALAAAATATAALATAVPTAAAVNQLSASAAEALRTKTAADRHLRAGLLLVNQRMDILQQQIDDMEKYLSLGCLTSLPSLCITPVPFEPNGTLRNASLQLSRYLLGSWDAEFENLTHQMLNHIVSINSTPVQVITAGNILGKVTSLLSHARNWAGTVALSIILLVAIVFCIKLLLTLRQRQQRDRVMVQQALLALQAGGSPQI